MIINFGEPLTLGELVDKLEVYEGIIAEFPNGYKRRLNRYSRLSKSEKVLPIPNNYKYDCNTGTYYVKVEKKDEASKAKELVKRALNSFYGINPPQYKTGLYCMCNDEIPLNRRIKKIIHNGPATIIFWNDGTKTVVKAQDEIDNEKGILYAALKKLATKKEYNDILRAIDADDIIMNNMDYFFPDRHLSPNEAEEFTKKETPKKKREYKYQKCPVCGQGYNLNWSRMSKLSKQGFVDIRCSRCDALFRVTGNYNSPKWYTKLEHEVLVKGEMLRYAEEIKLEDQEVKE